MNEYTGLYRGFGPFVVSCVLIGGLWAASCATVQQLAIKADMAYSVAVFALDDAEFAACHPTPALPADTCMALDAKVVQALKDVQSVTRSLQQFPTSVPKDLPSLLTDMNDIQAILVALPTMPVVTTLAGKVTDANAKAIALLTRIGGK